MKKKVFAFLLVGIMLMSLGAPVFAHSAPARRAVCTLEDCKYTTSHYHDGRCYAPQVDCDGHVHHVDCDIPDCTKTCIHQQDGRGNRNDNSDSYYGGRHHGRRGAGRHHR